MGVDFDDCTMRIQYEKRLTMGWGGERFLANQKKDCNHDGRLDRDWNLLCHLYSSFLCHRRVNVYP
jgi:hypothetical protein